MTRVPACRLLIGMSHAAQRGFAEAPPGELNAVGQPIRREAAWQADRRHARKIHRRREFRAARRCRRPGRVIGRQGADLDCMGDHGLSRAFGGIQQTGLGCRLDPYTAHHYFQ